MPNTPALVGAGFTALCEENSFSKASLGWAKELFATLGVVQVLFPNASLTPWWR